MKKEIKHVKNTMVIRNHYLTRSIKRHLLKEGRATLTKEENDQRTLDTYEGLGDSKVQIVDSTLQNMS